jgi:hypothetical protein
MERVVIDRKEFKSRYIVNATMNFFIWRHYEANFILERQHFDYAIGNYQEWFDQIQLIVIAR